MLRKALTFLIASSLMSLGSAETAVTGRVESVTRSVDVYKAGTNGWKKASTKTALSTDDKIRTGKRSVARVKLADGSKVLLLQNSQAEIEKMTSVQKTIKLLKGRVRAIVAKVKGGNNFQIKTPIGVASVRGTDFIVEVIEGPKDKPDMGEMVIEVNEGQVAASRSDISGEILVNAGEKLRFGLDGVIGEPVRSGAAPIEKEEIRQTVIDQQKKDAVVAMAAEESRNADYMMGKSLKDAFGQRVRVDSYIMRPASDQFKFVVLNERANHFDYFTYKGTFNTNLPEDLSIALKQIGGHLGTTAPTFYLEESETYLSNTIDNMRDSATGGHLVRIDFDGTDYTLTTTNPDLSTYTRTISAAELLSNGTYKVYDPVKDVFKVVTAANLTEAMKIAVVDPTTGDYKNLSGGDTFWKARFNTYTSFINSTAKMSWTPGSGITNTVATDLDVTFQNVPIVTISEYPDGTGVLHNRLSLFYADDAATVGIDETSTTVYDNYIIDDEGVTVSASAFNGITTSAAFKEQIDQYNYQQCVTADEFEGRHINFVADPRILSAAGLIQ